MQSIKIDSSDTEDAVIDAPAKTLTTKSIEKNASTNTEQDQAIRSNSTDRNNLPSAHYTSLTNCHERSLYSFTASSTTVPCHMNPLSSGNANHGSGPNPSGVVSDSISFDGQQNPPSTNRLPATQNVVSSMENQQSS